MEFFIHYLILIMNEERKREPKQKKTKEKKGKTKRKQILKEKKRK